MLMSKNNLLILGVGQYGMLAKEIAESMKLYEHIGFLDDNNPIADGKLDDYKNIRESYNAAIVAIGNAALRLKLIDELEMCEYEIVTLIHPNAFVSPSAVIGKGSFIEPMAVIQTDVIIGTGCIISAGTIVNHNSKVGDGCHLDCGTIIASNSVIQSMTKTQYGTKII